MMRCPKTGESEQPQPQCREVATDTALTCRQVRSCVDEKRWMLELWTYQ